MALDWSEAAKAKRSASAKKAAETRKRNRENPMRASMPKGIPEKLNAVRPDGSRCQLPLGGFGPYPYITNSRVARWALSGVSLLAILRANRHVRTGDPTLLMQHNYTGYNETLLS